MGYPSQLVESSLALAVQTQSRLTRALECIALSRRLLNPAWGLSGGADEDLSRSVRDRLDHGSLPLAPSRVWAEWGTLRTCIICSRQIVPSEVQNEAIIGGASIWVHLTCLRTWRDETAAYEARQITNQRAYQGDLSAFVREGFTTGTVLVLSHDRSWAGRGLSGNCSVCRKPVSPTEFAYEVLGGLLGHRAYAHPACYRVWLVESIAYRRASQGLLARPRLL